MPDKSDSMRCLLEVLDLPVDCFRLPDDGKRWKQAAGSRRMILAQFAKFANPDGSSIYPTIEKICRGTGLSERLVRIRVDDLVALGVMVNGKQRGVIGGRNRCIDMGKVRVLKPGNEDKPGNENPAMNNSKPGNESPKPGTETGQTRQSRLPGTAHHTEQTASLPPATKTADGWRLFLENLQPCDRMTKAPRSKAHEKALRALVAKYGGGLIASAVIRWEAQRGFNGMTSSPWLFFLKEAEPFLREAYADTPAGRIAQQAKEDAVMKAAEARIVQNARDAMAEAEARNGNEESLEEMERRLKELSRK